MTDAESRLWYNLRRHGLAGYRFRRQHPFGPYVLDFYCARAKLVVELDGGQHFEDAGRIRDMERTRHLEANGLRVLRFTDTQALLETEGVLNQILGALEPLSLTLSPEGRGDTWEDSRAGRI
jgi:very-short-patch-repair endonuclease